MLAKTGSSVWTLTGTTAFSGATTVDAGGLIVNGTLPSVVTINGGYLGGTGTVGGIIVNNGGTVAPGNSIGTLNVNGNVAFNAGSTFQVEINPAGQSDKIAATGTATLNGGTVQIVPLGAGFLANTQYTILTAAGGVSGTFATGSPLVTGQLSYDANNVYFLLQQIGGFGTLSGLTPNQAAVAGALDQAQLGGASGPLATAINTLAALNTPGIKAGLNDLAGQIHADGRRFVADQADMFQSFMWNAGTQSRGETVRMSASAYAPEPAEPIGKALNRRRAAPMQSVWFGGYGNWDKVAASDIAFGTNATIAGAALGADLWHMPGFTAGLAVGASTGQLRMAGRADRIEAKCGPCRRLRARRSRRLQSRSGDQLFLRGTRLLADDRVPRRDGNCLLVRKHLCRFARHLAAVPDGMGSCRRALCQGRLVRDTPGKSFRGRCARRESAGARRQLRPRLWHGRPACQPPHDDAEWPRGTVRRDHCRSS